MKSPEQRAFDGEIDDEEYLRLTNAEMKRELMSAEHKALLTQRQLERWAKRKGKPNEH